MGYIAEQNLLFPTSLPETINFVRGFYSQFDNRSAANKKIINVEPLSFIGVIAGTEFLTYAANKLYLGFNLCVRYSGGASVNQALMYLYDETNSISQFLGSNSIVWDATAANVKFVGNPDPINNLYFSRVALVGYVVMTFNGYRITLQ